MQSNRSPALSRHRNIGDARNPYWCGPEEFLIEEKLDGERMQLHKKGRKYKYFSRYVPSALRGWDQEGVRYTKS